MQELYRVVVTGHLTNEYEKEEVVSRFGSLFRLSATQAAKVLRGDERVVKRDIDEPTAIDYMIRILDCGADCYIEEVQDPDSPDFIEKRKGGERRVKYRREPRAGAIVPDRRLSIRRRKDVHFFRKIVDKNHEVPLLFQSYPVVLARPD